MVKRSPEDGYTKVLQMLKQKFKDGYTVVLEIVTEMSGRCMVKISFGDNYTEVLPKNVTKWFCADDGYKEALERVTEKSLR